LKYRRLGKTGLFISEIGLGTAQIGGSSLIGGRYIGSPRIKRKDALRILNTAYEEGINFYDTSDKYGDGEAERLLREAFCKKRDKVILATKCGLTSQGERCFREKYARSCLEQSLINLGTDHIDIFQLNKPDLSLIKSGQIYGLLNKLKREGKIRFTGVSAVADEEAVKLALDNRVDTLQVFYNLLHIEPNELFIGKAFDSGIGLIIKSPLSSGILTGKYSRNTKFNEEDDRAAFLYGEVLVSRVDMVDRISQHFRLNNGYSILHLALNYLLSNKRISSIIPGVSKVSQLIDILKLCSAERMNSQEIYRIESFIKQNYKEYKYDNEIITIR